MKKPFQVLKTVSDDRRLLLLPSCRVPRAVRHLTSALLAAGRVLKLPLPALHVISLIFVGITITSRRTLVLLCGRYKRAGSVSRAIASYTTARRYCEAKEDQFLRAMAMPFHVMC